MSRQCPYQVPIQLSDNRHCYRAGGTPGFVISLTLVAFLAGYAGLASAATVDNASDTRTSSATSASNLSGDLTLPS